MATDTSMELRPMKAFTIRLLLGASVILLAVVMAGQAHKNRQAKAGSDWSVPDSPVDPLVPIGAPNGSPDDSFPSTQPVESPENQAPNPFTKDAIQLVQHTEPVTDQKDASAPSTFAIPDMPTFAPAPATNAAPTGGEMALPGVAAPDTATGSGSEPMATLSLPTFSGMSETADSAPTAVQPPNALRGGDAPVNMMSEPGPEVVGPGPGIMAVPNAAADAPALAPMSHRPAPMMKAISLPEQPIAPTDVANQAPPTMGNMRIVSSGDAVDSPVVPTGVAGAGNGLRTPAPTASNPGGYGPDLSRAGSSVPGMMNSVPANVGGSQFGTPAVHSQPQAPQNMASQPLRTQAPINPAFGGMQPAPVRSGSTQAIGVPGSFANRPLPVLPASTQPMLGGGANGTNANGTLSSPGERRFDGVQSPSIVIHKRAPKEVKVGREASFAIHVQNTGSVEAMDVRVHDRIPSGMELVEAVPAPVQQGDLLMWQLGAMRAGDERTITLRLKPVKEGELGSVARVTFEAAASVRTISTRPQLKVVQRAPERVLIGQQLEIDLEVSNPGTGTATGVVLQEDVPPGLEHPKGRQLDNELGSLKPGESRRQTLRLRAVAPGIVQNTILLKGEDGLEARDTISVEVVSPNLQIDLTGPKKRFLERKATFNLNIANAGTAHATNVDIIAYLDRGFQFVGTENKGQYDQSRHAVVWSLENLPSNGSTSVPLTLLPVEEGERTIRLETRADLGMVAKSESTVFVDSLAELTFSINDSADPIEVGGETIYEIKLTNTGSRGDSNVLVSLQLPAGMQLLSSDAKAVQQPNGVVQFEPRRQFPANGELIYRVKARGVQPGTHLVKATVVSDQSRVPVTKEESTMVYSDR